VAKKKKLPHISRIFTAAFGHLVIWIIISIFFLSSFLATNPSGNFSQWRLAAIKDYKDPQVHLELAREYSATNNLESARRELLIGLSYVPENKELQKSLGEVENLLQEPDRVRKEIQQWEKISQDFPGYRDAYLQLTRLYYTLHQDEKAQEKLNKALELDPNFEPTQEMEEMLRD